MTNDTSISTDSPDSFNSTTAASTTNAKADEELFVNSTTAASIKDEKLVIWVPYLSLVCLVVVCVTLSFSFILHWRRAKKRQTNVQDYLEVNIDLKRKRLFGMMRMPLDVRVESRLSSFEDSGHSLVQSRSYFPDYHQHSYDFQPPPKNKALDVSSRGFGRDESFNGPIFARGGYGYNYNPADEFQHPFNATGDQRGHAGCRHHCVVSCQSCWKALRGELYQLLKSCQEDVQRKRGSGNTQNNYPFQNLYDSNDLNARNHHDVRSSGNVTKSEQDCSGSFHTSTGDDDSFRRSSRKNSAKGRKHRPSEREERENVDDTNGAIPKRGRYVRGSILNRRRVTETPEGTWSPSHQQSLDSYHEHVVHSDSELTNVTTDTKDGLQKQVSFGEDRKFPTRQSTSDDSELPPVLSLSSSSPLSSSSLILRHRSNGYPDNESKSLLREPSRFSLLAGETPDNHGSMPSISSAINSDVTVRDVTVTDGLTSNGGVINYGFQSDSCHSLATTSSPLDTSTTDKSFYWCDFPESPSSRGTDFRGSKRTKDKPYLTSQRHLVDFSMTSQQRTDSISSPAGSMAVQHRSSTTPQEQVIDLSVIEMDNCAFGQIASSSADTLTSHGHPYNGHSDVNV